MGGVLVIFLREMDMPIPCPSCGEVVELNDTHPSELLPPADGGGRYCVCPDCHAAEMATIAAREEIDEDEYGSIVAFWTKD